MANWTSFLEVVGAADDVPVADLVRLLRDSAWHELEIDVTFVPELRGTREVWRRTSLFDGGGSVGIVPVRLVDGTVAGGLCAHTATVDPTVLERDIGVVRMMAVIVSHWLNVRDESARRRQEVVERVVGALGTDGLRTVFQPIVDLTTGATVGYEALARFDGDPHRGPAEWFADAADVGLGVDLELAALQAALDQLDLLPPDAFLSLNVSAEALASRDVIDLLGEAPAGRIVLELTEHAKVDDYPALVAAVEQLRGAGVRLAIDDAGAGWASFRHVLALVPDVIKLDIGLTSDVDSDPLRRALAASLVTFADEIDAVIVAEGVETEAEIATLRRLGVAYGQGYRLGRPEPVDAVASSAVVEEAHRPQAPLQVVLERPSGQVLRLVAGC